METMQITISVPTNADNASIAAALRMRAGLFEGKSAKEAASRRNTDAEPLANGHDTTEAAVQPAKTAKGKKAQESKQEEFDLGFESEGEAEATKATLKDVIEACKIYCTSPSEDTEKAKRRATVAKLLEKFGAGKSVQNLKPEHFDKMLEVLGGK
jgi:hypothetical protein